MVIWITGLSGSGKSTIGRLVWRRLREIEPNTVLVDGDEVRRMLGLADDASLYTLDGRRRVAERIAALCGWLDRQRINVVSCTISLFEDIHRRNRETLSGYVEVFLDVPMDVLRRRDTKGLYSGDVENVVGLDLPYTEPASPDLRIDNTADRDDFDDIADRILDRALGR